MLLLAIIAFLLSPRSAAQDFDPEAHIAAFETPSPARVDLSGQFPDGSRSQGRLNSCHAFVAVALVEAAYYRQHGVHARFSEADLFVRRNALRALPFLRSFEGGLVRPDAREALEGGLLPGDHYADFEARWHAFRKPAFKFLDSRGSVAAELLPESLGPEAVAAREKSRTELSGFSVGGESFLSLLGANARSLLKKDRVGCSVARRERMLTRQLDAGRPVGVGLHTGWTKDPVWRRDAAGEGGSHYFVVTGYDRTAEGLVFHTRNTWRSGINPDLSGRDLCEIYGLTWVRAPSDAR